VIQFDFFEPCEVTVLKWELEKAKKSNEKTKKTLLAKYGELAKNYLDLLERIDLIEKNYADQARTQLNDRT